MTASEEYFDVNAEPARFDGAFEPDHTEQKVPPIDGHEDEISTVRDSVLNEPAFTGQLQQAELSQWLAEKRVLCTLSGNIWLTLAVALVAGSFAIIGAMIKGVDILFTLNPIVSIVVRFFYIILYGPVIEELLKQSGMIYLLEKKPYRIFSAGQFVAAGAISALVFASLENLLYIHFYAKGLAIQDFSAFCWYRWTVCTSLHVSCSVIASLGLVRVWKKQCADGRAADLSIGFYWFAAAMILHGLYNLTVTILHPHF